VSFMSRASRWRAAFRFDGSFWRKFAYLGCVYGPEWWKVYSPGPIAAIIFALVGRNRRGTIANLEVVLGDRGRLGLALAALRTYAEFGHCFTEATEYYSPRRKPVRFDVPETTASLKPFATGGGRDRNRSSRELSIMAKAARLRSREMVMAGGERFDPGVLAQAEGGGRGP
jgi:hypothetical protein